MNFDVFRETLSSFARTAEKIQAFATHGPEASTEGSFPLLYFPESGDQDEVPRLDSLATVHSLCNQVRGVSVNQAAWNQQLSALCLDLGRLLPRLMDVLHVEPDRKEKAQAHLNKMRGKFKEAGGLARSRQRRKNAAVLHALELLNKAHQCLGQSRLKKARISDKDFWKKLETSLRDADRANAKAGRGLRRLLGILALDQRSINHGCYRVVEKIVHLHSRAQHFEQRRQQQASKNSARALQQSLMDQNGPGPTLQALSTRVEILSERTSENFYKATSKVLRNFREGDTYHLPASLTSEFATTANYLAGPLGPHGRAGHTWEEPVQLALDADLNSQWRSTTAQIVERFWLMNRLPSPGSSPKVLDIGSSSSLLALELASSGYEVTAVDSSPYPLHHPRLRSMVTDCRKLPFADASFDAVICLSTVEHVALGRQSATPETGGDLAVVQEARRVLKPGGSLFLSAPYGVRGQDKVRRIYDDPALTSLLGGFSVTACDYAIRRNDLVWERSAAKPDAAQLRTASEEAPRAVALIAAQKS